MLSNIVFIIILVLLVIILILLYFFSNDIRKNKNKINICESDINSLRERITTLNQKINVIENDLTNNFSKKSGSKSNMQNPVEMINQQNFAEILEKLGSMNNEYYEGEEDNGFYIDEEDEDEDEDEDDEEGEDDEEDEDEGEDEDDDEEDSDDEDSDDEKSSNNTETKSDKSSKEIVEVQEDLNENLLSENKTELIVEEEKGINNLLESPKSSGPKGPKKSPSDSQIGDIEFGSDNKTKYILQLNKIGRKFWKKV